jgi:hypothetical protein
LSLAVVGSILLVTVVASLVASWLEHRRAIAEARQRGSATVAARPDHPGD